MLVLSRKKDEAIIINGNIIVKVVEIRGDKVRVGIIAPKDVPVDREETHAEKNGLLYDKDLDGMRFMNL